MEVKKENNQGNNINNNKYENLKFACKAYSVAEGVFPVWEAVFALIVGQLIIAYFSSDLNHWQKIIIALLGLVLSFSWLLLVGLNYLNADHISNKMRNLRDGLQTNEITTEFVWPWPEGDTDKKNWSLCAIITGRLSDSSSESKATLYRSTWFWRKVPPGILSLSWIALMIWQFIQIYVISHKIYLIHYIREWLIIFSI